MGKKKPVYTETTHHPVRKNRFEVLASDSEEESAPATPLSVTGPVSNRPTGGTAAPTTAAQAGSVDELRNRWAVGATTNEFPNFFSRGLRHVPVSPPTTWDVPMFLDEERFPSAEGSPSVFPVLSIPKQTEPYGKGGSEGRFSVSTPKPVEAELAAEICLIQEEGASEEGVKGCAGVAGMPVAAEGTDGKEKTFAMRIKESLDAVEREKQAHNLEKNHTNRVEAIRSSLTQLSFFRRGVT